MIILDRSGRDLVRRPPPIAGRPGAALLALALAAILAGAAPQAAVFAQPGAAPAPLAYEAPTGL